MERFWFLQRGGRELTKRDFKPKNNTKKRRYKKLDNLKETK